MTFCARGETRTLKDVTPTASETATFTNFATRAGAQEFTLKIFVPRTGVEPARFPATPSKWCVYQFRHLGQ